MTDLQELQIRAFDEARALLPAEKGQLTCNGKTASVIPSDVRNSRLLKEAGYSPDQVTTIEIKRTDFDNLGIAFKLDVVLDGKTFRPIDINDDKTDAIINVTL